MIQDTSFGAFLTWLEDREAPVFVAATANDLSRLPPEFTRKGRFAEVMEDLMRCKKKPGVC